MEQEREVRQVHREIDQEGTMEERVEAILNRERRILKQAMEGYTFHPKLKAKYVFYFDTI